ncbi:MAG: response regulator [Oscillospiraceae bacterium]|nr:response regulator [Oscillospiraceae bacterium]
MAAVIAIVAFLIGGAVISFVYDAISKRRPRSAAENEGMTQFLANMSHEMRTPLNAIIGLSELTLSGEDLRGDSYDNLEKIYASGVALLGIINDILDISKIESGLFALSPVDYDTPSLINDILTLNVLRVGDKPVKFSLAIDENIPSRLFGDELRLKQVFNSILDNAFKYTEVGSVDWRVSCEDLGDSIRLVSSVTDTGSGIRPEDMSKLFLTYDQIDSASTRRKAGAGLSLSIAKRVVDLMDGTITVQSAPGRGSTFTVTVTQKKASDSPLGAHTAENLRNFKYATIKRQRNTALVRIHIPYARVLVVDDVQTNLDVAKGIMRPYGMAIDCVTTGQAAVDLIRAGEPVYSAIFMDHMMPGMDGIEATQIIRNEIGTDYARNLPIIALTANALVGNEEMFLKSGFQAFLAKPIDVTRMDAVIRTWVRDKSKEDERGRVVFIGDADAAGKTSLSDRWHIYGLDLDRALSRFGDESALLMILRSYAANTQLLLEQMRHVNEDNLSDYSITVHGIKGSSYGICADVVGKEAERLEQTAKAGNIEEVLASNTAFIGLVESLIADLAAMLTSIDSQITKPTSDKPNLELLHKLYIACGEFDIDTVDAIMDELESFEYAAQGEVVVWLRENVNVMDFDSIRERLSELCDTDGKG